MFVAPGLVRNRRWDGFRHVFRLRGFVAKRHARREPRPASGKLSEVVLFGIGSPILVDYEETLHRVGASIVAGVRNRQGSTYLGEGVREIGSDAFEDGLRAIPFLVPLFTPAHRFAAVTEALALGLVPRQALLDPTSVLPRRISFGAGSYVNAGCTLGSASRFGDFVLVNRGVTIGHDAVFGAFVSTGPGAVVAGNVTVGDRTMLGAGCTILPEITIGEDVIVGAGAVVTKDIPPRCFVLGNPARIVRDDLGRDRPE